VPTRWHCCHAVTSRLPAAWMQRAAQVGRRALAWAAAAGLALGGEKVETEHGRDCGSLLRGCRGPPFRTSCRLPATGSTSPAPWRRPP
jgi:hypothetical protein